MITCSSIDSNTDSSVKRSSLRHDGASGDGGATTAGNGSISNTSSMFSSPFSCGDFPFSLMVDTLGQEWFVSNLHWFVNCKYYLKQIIDEKKITQCLPFYYIF